MQDIFRFIDKTKYSFQSNDPKNSTNKEFVRIPKGVNILLSQPLPLEYRMSNVEITNIKGFLGGESEIFLIFHELFHSAVKENFFWFYKSAFEKVNHQIDEKDLSKIKSVYLEFWDEGITDFLAKTAYLYYCRSRHQILPFEYSCYPFHLDFIGNYVAGHAHSLRDMNDYHNPDRINTNDKEIYYEAFKTFYKWILGQDIDAYPSISKSATTRDGQSFLDYLKSSPDMSRFIQSIENISQTGTLDKFNNTPYPIMTYSNEPKGYKSAIFNKFRVKWFKLLQM